MFRVTDDSGFLAIVDPDAYPTFLGADWDWKMIQRHFVKQMQGGALLIWGTGREETWEVHIGEPVPGGSFRAIEGTIWASSGRLHLTSFDDLSYAASYDDATLPLPHSGENVLVVQPGTYRCMIEQLRDPEGDEEEHGFRITLCQVDEMQAAPWREIPWFERPA